MKRTVQTLIAAFVVFLSACAVSGIVTTMLGCDVEDPYTSNGGDGDDTCECDYGWYPINPCWEYLDWVESVQANYPDDPDACLPYGWTDVPDDNIRQWCDSAIYSNQFDFLECMLIDASSEAACQCLSKTDLAIHPH